MTAMVKKRFLVQLVGTVIYTFNLTGATEQAPQKIIDLLKNHIQQNLNLSSDFNLIFDNPNLNLDGRYEREETVSIKNLQILANGQRFTAQIVESDDTAKDIVNNTPSPAQSLARPPQMITGQIQLLMAVPVLSRPISLTEEIQESDITWQKFPLNRLNSTHLTLISDLIGRIPNGRILQPGQPLNRFDVRAPIVIKRGAYVQVTYKTPNITVARRAEAQQDGAQGETIRFLVSESKKTIHATILNGEEAELKL